MQNNLTGSISHNWREMDRALRISTAMGLVSGAWLPLAVYVFKLLPAFSIGAFFLALLSFYFPFLAFYVVGPAVSFTGAIALLFRPMNAERRGVIGFMVFATSLPSILMIFTYAAAVAAGKPLFPRSSTK